MKAGRRISLAFGLSLILFLPVAYASTTTLTSPNPISLGQFGLSVAISGTTVVVGAPHETVGTTTLAGRAYVFDATTGGLISPLTSPNPISFGQFGQSVAISGTTVVVGAPAETVGTTTLAGRAYVFDAMTGGLISTLISSNLEFNGRFGSSVGVDGATVVVGAESETVGTTTLAGRAYVFDATSGGLISTLTSPNPVYGGDFGSRVAISDTTVAVGASREMVDTTVEAGRAYVFDATSGGLISTLTSPNPKLNGAFGSSVAISLTTVAVGAPGETADTTTQAGHAYVFDATTGGLISTLTSPSPSQAGFFGFSVGIFVDDATVVVGAPFELAGTPGVFPGHAYVFF